MDWKIEAELLFFSPFLFFAVIFGIAEGIRIFLEVREESREAQASAALASRYRQGKFL